MKEVVFFESFGTVVVGIKFTQSSEKVARFDIIQAIDYPEIDHDADGNEIATVNYFNPIGRDGEVVEQFEEACLIASGNIVIQFPEDKVNPIAYTIEFQPGVIFNGQEFNDLVVIIQNKLPEQAYLFLNNQTLNKLERVKVDFSVV